MADQSVTVHVPAPRSARLAERARQAHRSVEDELLEVVAAGVAADGVLLDDLEAAIAPLAVLDDEALWRAVRRQLPATAVARMQALHDKRDVEGLTSAKQETLETLVQCYARDHDVSSLIRPVEARWLSPAACAIVSQPRPSCHVGWSSLPDRHARGGEPGRSAACAVMIRLKTG